MLRLLETKATAKDEVPRRPRRGAWVEEAEIEKGPLFRLVSKSDRALPRPLSSAPSFAIA